MSNFGDMATGLVTVLESNITNLKGFNYPVDSVNSFPCAVVLPDSVDLAQTFDNSIAATFRVVFLVSSADDRDGFRRLYDYIDPTESNKGFRAAIEADDTLDGKADSSQVLRIENIGRREIAAGWYFGFDALVVAIKGIT
jgi:hypothetical protein